MQLRVHNTLTRTKEVFEPQDPKRVRMYVCGPTVYQRIHVGNARAFVVFDVLYRLLRHLYGEDHVVYVRNITDIDDKIIDQARANGESIRELTDRTAADFQADLTELGCLQPTHEPRATEHVAGMIAMIGTLIERGHAYAADGHVLFNVPSMPAYGRLSRRDRDEQIAGARVDVAPYKRDPADFVLWKPSVGDQPGWDSPWGHGRPGWHIECSAMSEEFLGPLPFDLHAGGLDLIFPHHENEIAQSCCAHGIDTMARYWMHNGFLDMRGEKMSKSLGNIVRVHEAVDALQGDGEVLRLWLLRNHYRQPIDYTDSAIESAKTELSRLYGSLARIDEIPEIPPDMEFVERLSDDLNTWDAIQRLVELRSELNRSGDLEIAGRLKSSAAMLGILSDPSSLWFHGKMEKAAGEYVGQRIAERQAARVARDFSRADAIRAELEAQGIILEDNPAGTTWRRA